MNKTRNIRIYQVPQEFVMDLLRVPFSKRESSIVLPEPLNIPSDASVLGVYVNYEMRAFDFVVAHESFMAVEDGCIPPRFNCEFGVVRVATKA